MNAPVKAAKAPNRKVTDYNPTAMRMTWAHACRDIVITALNNGQIITKYQLKSKHVFITKTL